ncbi:MAG: SDR family NAD(P)-dependent oxidoreductase [Ruminococcaceae bacterium]|nr:SDR family NAD(P)-dependent oxidoreductase [Oscillospiraceae bacterium]
MSVKKWLAANTASLAGKTVAITGATGALGRALCHYLAELGAALVLMDRNPARSGALREELLADHAGLRVQCLPVDLAQMESVRAASEKLNTLPVDAFIHNAGAYAIPRHTCDTGLDNVFQINFASPYYLIRELLPTLRARRGRVVAVGSIAHDYARSDPADVDFSTRRRASLVYGNAKRYLMFALFELFKNEQDVTLAITHPGISFTGITAHYPKPIFALIKHPMKIIFMKPKKAALSILRGVFAPTAYGTWWGPRIFGVWGLPKKKALRTATEIEAAEIAARAERIFAALKE